MCIGLSQDDVVGRKQEEFQVKGPSKMLYIEFIALKNQLKPVNVDLKIFFAVINIKVIKAWFYFDVMNEKSLN